MKQANIFVISSWDDVTRLDLKLCELLETYKLKGTFFVVNNWMGKKISKDGLLHISESHEVGAHTLNHVNLTHIPAEVAKREIFESKRLLEKVLGKPVTSFAYPQGSYDKNHVEMVRNAKYLCARTTKPFYTAPAENPYELNVTIWAYPHALRDIRGMFRLFNLSPNLVVSPLRIKKWNELGKQIFDVLLESGGVFHFFGHAWQVEEIDGWRKLEDLLAHIAFRKNVTCVTITEHAKLCYYSGAK
ncbi:MAG: polysaccharide deacetylase family protein [Candidatus Helarchaeota archaeon]|nr:polysaccharide deacetylase family protein [Candidatus Helarchaeota archaeon]